MISTYYTPTRITFGPGAEDRVAEEIEREGKKKVLIHYGSSRIEKNGLLDKIIGLLKEKNIESVLVPGVVPNPRLSLVRETIEKAKEEKVDFILAVGGGSVIDSSKAVAYGLGYDGDVWDFYSGKAKPVRSFPVGAVLTVSAAGSEMSDSSVITNDEEGGLKRGCNSDICRLRFALLNPELTYTLPQYETACSIVDIAMHTLERYFTKEHTVPLTEDLSLTLIKSVNEYGLEALENPTSYKARATLMWASSLSHNGLMAVGNFSRGDWASHQMEHELSGKYDIAHGAGLAIVWPAWAKYVYKECPEHFRKLGEAVFDLGENEDPLKTIEAFENFYRRIGMPLSLKEASINATSKDIDELSDKCSFYSTRTIGDIKKLTRDDIEKIYRTII